MNNIQGVNGYGGPRPVRSHAEPGTGAIRPSGPPSSGKDKVEISQVARYLSELASMPEIRAEKVEQVSQALANGTYDLNGKFPIALDRLLDEYI